MDGSDPDAHATPGLRKVGDSTVIRVSIDAIMETMNTNPPLLSSLGIASLLLVGCEMPLTGSDGKTILVTDTVYIAGTDTFRFDSLDAQAGKDRFNDYLFLQGNLESTGRILDLAIAGTGLFVLKNRERFVYFRRPASFIHDAEGFVSLGNDGTRLQGVKLSNGQAPYLQEGMDSIRADKSDPADLVDIHWPFDDLAPPRATTEIRLTRNLDSDAAGKGSILYTQKFLHHAEASDALNGLSDHAGTELGIRTGDVLTVTVSVEAGAIAKVSIPIVPGFTLAEFAAAITAFLRGPVVSAGLGTSVELLAPVDDEWSRGAMTIYGNAAAIRNFMITSSRPISGPMVTKAFAVPADIPAGTLRMAVTTTTLRSPARAVDPMGELFDANGNRLGLENGDAITFSGSLGGEPAANAPPLTFAGGPAGTALQDILDGIRANFGLPERDGNADNLPSVSLNAAGSDDNIPDGSIVIRGQAGTESTIADLTVRSTDFNNSKPTPTFFNTNLNATTLREATGDQIVTTVLSVFDESGGEHEVTMAFTPSNTPFSWLWQIKLGGRETLLAGSAGGVAFGQDGSVAAFTFDGGGTHLEFDPGNGAEKVRVAVIAGGPGDFTGLTTFRSESTARFTGQDGCRAGTLTQISIGQDGILSGSYTNGQSRNLFQIPLADFPNKRGLKLIGENSFLETRESGVPVFSAAGHNAMGVIAPGALEAAVD